MAVNPHNSSMIAISPNRFATNIAFRYSSSDRFFRQKIGDDTAHVRETLTFLDKELGIEELAFQEELDQWDALSDEALSNIEEMLE